MRQFRIFLLIALSLLGACNKNNLTATPIKHTENVERNGESGISYQLLVYSFADSNGDGIGDFKGIESKLDYLRSFGVQALWLSPVHPCGSYHGYDVKDYYSLNPDFGSEADFVSLLSSAHNKGIKIYMDFVLNHCSISHPWFVAANSDPTSPYRNYFVFSENPQADISQGKIPTIATEGSNGYDAGQWFSTVSSSNKSKIKFTLKLDAAGKPSSIKAEQVETISNSGSNATNVWLYYGDGKMQQFYKTDAQTLSLSLEIESSWGVLIRTSQNEWGSYKYGASSGSQTLIWGQSLALNNTSALDILLPGMTGAQYHSHFWTSWFADFNYGPAASAEQSPAFIDLCGAADKWIKLGVDGFRLDAIKHIYHNANSDENPIFLKKFYDHCNATYKANGSKGDIYVIGEHLSEASEVAPYYKGLPAFFNFSFWWRLKDAINNSKGNGFVSTLQNYRANFTRYRSDYIEATKLSNHDENRTGSDFNKDISKMKLAGAVLLTMSGQPYIYQGEELGYYGVKNNGDEYVRTPIMWNKNGSGLAKTYLGSKYSGSMLIPAISVESQSSDEQSILSVYRKFGEARDSYYALSKGDCELCTYFESQAAICAYFRSFDTQKLLVIHNFSSATQRLKPGKGSYSQIVVSNGNVSYSNDTLTMGAYSSVVFIQ